MRPRLSAVNSNIAARTTAALSRWTHRVGVTGPMCTRRDTPTRNAIGLSRPTACGANFTCGRLARGVPSSPLKGEVQIPATVAPTLSWSC